MHRVHCKPDFLKRLSRTLACALALVSSVLANAETIELNVYLDADRQGHLASALAIELGVRTALSEVDYEIAGYRLNVVPFDHRGNVKRSKLTMRKYLADDSALAIVGGMHSPPYLRYQHFINWQRVLLLLPWSAAGPLTRVEFGENWVFRLSVDDTKAAERLVEFAQRAGSCDQPALVLWESGWGRTNEKTLSQSLTAAGFSAVPTFYFQGSLRQSDAFHLADKVAEAQVDCVFLVSQTTEGAQIVTELARLPNSPMVISHWGITGADFQDVVPAEKRDAVDLHFLQTCYPFDRADTPENVVRAWNGARNIDPSLDPDITELRAPAGFFHAYDLTKILLKSLAKHPGIVDIRALRILVHDSLEALDEPVDGLMSRYEKPFNVFDPSRAESVDAHEALGLDALCMARWDSDGYIQMIPNTAAALR